MTLRFLFLDETPGAYFLKKGGDDVRISAAPYTISAPYRPADLDRLEVYKGVGADPETGRPVLIKVAEITQPSDLIAALVIVTPRHPAPGSTEPAAYRVEFVDNGPQAFPAGSVRILNLGRAEMAGQFGTTRVAVAPGATKVVTPVVDPRGRVRTRIATQTEEGWRLINDNVDIVKPESRLTGVLLYSPSGLRFRFGKGLLAERGDPPPGHVWLTYTDAP